MSYRRNRIRRPAPLPMGSVASTITTAAGVVTDPYFNETVCRVQQLSAIERKQAVPTCAKTAPGIGGGVGLRKAMPALRAYVYAERHKWVYAAAVAGVIGLPMLAGYALGRKR